MNNFVGQRLCRSPKVSLEQWRNDVGMPAHLFNSTFVVVNFEGDFLIVTTAGDIDPNVYWVRPFRFVPEKANNVVLEEADV